MIFKARPGLSAQGEGEAGLGPRTRDRRPVLVAGASAVLPQFCE